MTFDEWWSKNKFTHDIYKPLFKKCFEAALKSRGPANIHCFYHGGVGCMNQRFKPIKDLGTVEFNDEMD